MAERLFLLAALLLGGGYALTAALAIRAPIQYDPLGPETWPMILGGLLVLAAGARLCRPVGARIAMERRAGLRLLAALAMLALYAVAFQRVGFTLSTAAFCAGLTWMLGTRPVPALVFGASAGVLTYLLFARVLDLRLPAGPLGGVV